MAGTTDNRHFVELSEFAVSVLRTSGPRNATVIEAYHDASWDDEAAVKEAIGLARSPDAQAHAPVICSLRPAERLVHLANTDEAAKHSSASALSSFLAQRASLDADSGQTSAVYFDTGHAVDGSAKTPWLGEAASRAKAQDLLAKLEKFGVKAEQTTSSVLSLCGTLRGVLAASDSKDSVVSWELGRTKSDLILVSARGVEATRRVGIGFDAIAEAILAEIHLKFKGAAAKLFFNTRYDFSSTAPTIAKRIGDALANELSQLASKRNPGPKKFVMAGFPAKQDWFAKALAPCVGLELFDLNVEPWLIKSGLRINDKSTLTKLSPASLGVFGLAAAHCGQNAGKSPAWHPGWSAPASQGDAAKPSAPASSAQQKSATVTPARLVTVASQLERERGKTAHDVAEAKAAAADGARPQAGPAPAPQSAPAANTESAPAAQAGPAAPRKPTLAKPPKAETKSQSSSQPNVLPSGVRIADPDTIGISERSMEASKLKKGQTIRNLAVAAVVACLLGVGYIFFQHVEKQKQAALQAKQVAEQQAAALERARFEAEQKARAEAAARQRAEEEAAAKAAAAEAARVQAEEEARQRQAERERLLHARGAVEITSIPSGAKVTIANLEPQLTPASFSDLRLGQYRATLELSGYDSTTVDFSIEDSKTTSPGPVRLARHTGRLEIITKPVGVHFEVKPASESAFTSAMQSRIGITPHTLGALPTDEYTVTLNREGWATITRTVKIERNQTTQISENLAGGSVKITSNPTGASVFNNDTLLGSTPLEIADVAPGEHAYLIEHPEYTPVTLTANVKVAQTIELTATLEPVEVLARISELDRKPTPVKRVEPALDDPKRFVGHYVVIALVVNEQGLPEDVQIDEASDPEFGQLCADAVRQWEFKPARIGRTPVKTKVKIPFKTE